MRLIWMVIRREWFMLTVYPLNTLLGSIVQPLTWLAPFYFLGLAFGDGRGRNAYFGQLTGTTDFMSWVLAGLVVGAYMGSTFWGMGFALRTEMVNGTLEINWLSPAPRWLLLTGVGVFQVMLTTCEMVLLLGLAALFFGFHPQHFLPLLAVVPLVVIGLYGFGFGFAALTLLVKDANTLVDMGNSLLNVVSGENVPVQSFPRWLAAISLLLPITYALDLTRVVMLGTRPLIAPVWEWSVLAAAAIGFTLLGVWLFGYVDRRIRQRGTISFY